MSVTMSLKLTGIPGGSTTIPGSIDVLAFSWGASSPSSAVGGAGKPSVQDLSVTAYIDQGTAVLTQKMLLGAAVTKAVLTVAPSTLSQPTDTYTMTTVYVTSVSLGGSGGEDRLTVNYSFDFGQLDFLLAGKHVTWNLVTSTP